MHQAGERGSWTVQALVCFPHGHTIASMLRSRGRVQSRGWRGQPCIWEVLSHLKNGEGLAAGKPVERCAKNETGWEGQLHNLQGPVQNANVSCCFKKEEKSVIKCTETVKHFPSFCLS